MLTRGFAHSAYSYLLSGKGFMAGLSIVSKRCFLDTFIFCRGRLLNSSSFCFIALLRSPILKKVWFRNAAMIHRSAIRTADSTLALSRAFLTLAGMIAVE